MPPVGNDIVETCRADARTRHEDLRFLDKVFTAGERERIAGAPDPCRFLWTLWAAKEAAYKAVKQRWPEARFSPKRFTARMEECPGAAGAWRRAAGDAHPKMPGSAEAPGRVESPWGDAMIRAHAAAGWVHCIALLAGEAVPRRIAWGVGRIGPEGQSPAVRRALARCVAGLAGTAPERVSVRRSRGAHGLAPPRVCVDGRPAQMDVSLSHDGETYAWALALVNGEPEE